MTYNPSSGGASDFTDLGDVPASYSGQTGKFVKVNAGETALEFAALAGGGDLLAANNLSDVANASTARTNLGLAIGTNVQAYSADLADLDTQWTRAGVTSAQMHFHEATGNGTDAVTLRAPTALGGTVVVALPSVAGTIVTTAGDTFTGDISVPDEAYGAGWNGSAEVPTKNAVYDKIETLQAAFLLAAYPVGAIYTSVVSTSPATLFGGTWSAFGAGRVMVGIDAGQTEFDTVEETGGSKTHTLTEAEMPSHTHVQNSHTHAWNDFFRSATTGAQTSQVTASNDTSSTLMNATVPAATATNQNTGGGGAHNNLQPYIVVYMWKRTA